jgi:DUF1365 family protein
LFMTLLDLDELEYVFRGRWLWSVGRPNLAWFRRADYLDGGSQPLGDAVRALVKQRTGRVLAGPIRLLTHLRTFGTCFNPISLYFCYDSAGRRVETIVAEVTNTPWGERHCYVLDSRIVSPRRPARGQAGPLLHYRFAKALHVSPFLGMNYMYDLRMNAPHRTLAVQLENWRAEAGAQAAVSSENKVHDATLTLERRPLTGPNLAGVLLRFPFITVRIVAAIYWQALRLKWKGIPYVPHPGPAVGAAGN